MIRRTFWLTPEFCPGPLFQGWQLYQREHEARREPANHDHVWFKSEYLARLHRLLGERGVLLPDPAHHRDTRRAFMDGFAAAFPAGLLIEQGSFGEAETILSTPPDPRFAAKLLLFNARGILDAERRDNSMLAATCPCKFHKAQLKAMDRAARKELFAEPLLTAEMFFQAVITARTLRDLAHGLRRGEALPVPALPAALRQVWIDLAEQCPRAVPPSVVLALSGRRAVASEPYPGDLCALALDLLVGESMDFNRLIERMSHDGDAPYDEDLVCAMVMGLLFSGEIRTITRGQIVETGAGFGIIPGLLGVGKHAERRRSCS